LTEIDVSDQCSLVIEMEVGDNSTAGPSQLGYYWYKHPTASPTANVTRDTCASPAPTYDPHR